jgi:hypothetical protein
MNAHTDLSTLRAPKEASLAPVRAGFFDLASFELIQRVSKAFAGSDLVPKQYQGNLANCMIAMDMAQRIGANPLMVMQNLYIVHGTPGWSSKFLIATINACGRYSSLRYEWKGKPGEPGYGCRAWAIERETGERLDGIWVTWEMVRAEGWDSKNGSKWKTMPDQMFVYRCASFWQRAYAPELGMGLQTTDEIHDVFDAGRGNDGRYSVDIDSLRTAEKVDKDTGEIMPPEKIEQKQPVTVPQTIEHPEVAEEWRPDPEEEAAIRAAEQAEAQQRRTEPPAATRPRRERGSLGME